MWKKKYLPSFSLKDKVVLDVGAGAGETAYFYFENEARSVIAVEPNSEAVNMLRQNAKVNHWNVQILEVCFKLDHLELQHDFMKMDCEGCEQELLRIEPSLLKPCIIEVHSNELSRLLREKFNLRIVSYARNVEVSSLMRPS